MAAKTPRRRRPARTAAAAKTAATATAAAGGRITSEPGDVAWFWRLFAVVLAATAFAYLPVWHGGMLWDDDGHLTRASLQSFHGLWQIWFQIGATQQYYPLTHSVFWIEHALWGDATLGYHLVNIALHATSACVFALILRRLKVPGAAIAAVLFALHPIQVESVAWMTELKNTLAGVFYFAAALVYVRFDERRDRRGYLIACALFVLGLLCKTVVATLPVALLAAVWWKRGTLSARRDVTPVVPWLAAGAAAGAITAFVERAYIGARGAEFAFGVADRTLIAGRDIWFYLATLAWPADLVFIYPRWTIRLVWWQFLFPIAAVALAIALWAIRRRSRAPFAAFAIFAATLAPALGFVNVFPFRYSFVADHFAYLAVAAPMALVAAGLAKVARRLGTHADRWTAAAIALPLALLTWQQSAHYVSAEALYRDTIGKNPACWMCETNLAALLLASPDHRTDEAIAHARAAIAIRSDDAEAHANLGAGLERKGDLSSALAEYRAAREGYSDSPADVRLGKVYHGIGRMLVELGRPIEALPDYELALRYQPQSVDLRVNAGVAYSAAGDLTRAEEQFAAALALDPNSANAHSDLGAALMQQERFAEAIPHLESAIRLDARNPDSHFNLAIASEHTGQLARAIDEFRQTVALDPSCDACREHLRRLGGR